jgi:hypothetical protein
MMGRRNPNINEQKASKFGARFVDLFSGDDRAAGQTD